MPIVVILGQLKDHTTESKAKARILRLGQGLSHLMLSSVKWSKDIVGWVPKKQSLREMHMQKVYLGMPCGATPRRAPRTKEAGLGIGRNLTATQLKGLKGCQGWGAGGGVSSGPGMALQRHAKLKREGGQHPL